MLSVFNCKLAYLLHFPWLISAIATFKTELTLPENVQVKVTWNLLPDREISFRVDAVTSSDSYDWFIIGFTDQGEETDLDGCMIPLADQPQFKDIWINEGGEVEVDAQQDWMDGELAIGQHGFKVYLKRKLSTCDNKDLSIDNGTTQLVLAMGKENYFSGIQLTKTKIIEPLRLFKHEPNRQAKNDIKENYEVMDVTVNNVPVPGVETTYWCNIKKLPLRYPARKLHVIRYESLIQPGNEDLVHHMEIFHCEDPVVEPYEGPCDQTPPSARSCNKVLAAWAMGAEPLIYPEEAGLPIGGPDFGPFVRIEVHYNNPGLRSGVVDNSGMRFLVTWMLRPFDAGVMELGLEYTNKMAIPPRQAAFPLTGYCTPQCTEMGLPGHGIAIFASQLHAHLTGHQLWTRHVRNGRELPMLNADHHFATHWQEIRQITPPRIVLPGDALITTCIYNTKKRENVTLGGNAITDEMCVNYVHYYPKARLEVCKSSVDTTVLNNYFSYLRSVNSAMQKFRIVTQRMSPRTGLWFAEIEKLTQRQIYDETGSVQPMSVYDMYHSIKWDPELVDQLKELYRGTSLSMQCNQSDGSRFPGGNAITDEMCVNYVHYYPKARLEVCKSSVDTTVLNNYFSYLKSVNSAMQKFRIVTQRMSPRTGLWFAEIEKLTQRQIYDEPGLSSGSEQSMSVYDMYHSIKWDPELVDQLKELYRGTSLSMQCNQSDGSRFPVSQAKGICFVNSGGANSNTNFKG